MGALIVTPEIKAEIAEKIALARKNPVPVELLQAGAVGGPTITLKDRKPGIERPPSQHVILGTYRAAISFEQQPVGLCRHLSISALKPGTLPHRVVLEEIAALFGIDGSRPPLAGHIWFEEFDPGHYAVNFLQIEETQH